MRRATFERSTNESTVTVDLTLEARGTPGIATTARMLDHLLEQWAFHGKAAVAIQARSLDGIQHHVVEDVAIALGTALDRALGDRAGIARFGSALIPMDEALARVAVDLSGRPYARTALRTTATSVEGLDLEMVPHFWSSFAQAARLAIHADVLAGDNAHHCIEALFKAAGIALAQAWQIDDRARDAVPSTKGSL